MITRMILILMILLTLMLLFTNENNSMKSDESTLYFSINNTINSRYIKDNSKNVETLKSYFYKKNEELGNKFPKKVSIPDSLSGEILEVEKGFYVVKIDSIVTAPYQVNNFELDREWVTGRFIINFNSPFVMERNKPSLSIMSNNAEILKEISSFSPEFCMNAEIEENITKLIANYFYDNREELESQLTRSYPIADSIADNQLKKEITSKFKLEFYTLNKDTYYIIGTYKEYEYHKFFSIVNLKNETMTMEIHTNYYQTFKMKNEFYFFCRSYQPYTGANTFIVYKLKGNKLERVFSDGSFST